MENKKDQQYTGDQQYMGDGVYASFDGYYIHLAVNHHENEVILLDPEVMENLVKFWISK